MVMKRVNDSIVEVLDPLNRLKFVYVDVTDTVNDLSQSHGYSVEQAIGLGQALLITSLLSFDHVGLDETMSFNCQSQDGQIGGCHIVYDGRGHFRGHIYNEDKNDKRWDGDVESISMGSMWGYNSKISVQQWGTSTNVLSVNFNVPDNSAVMKTAIETMLNCVEVSVSYAWDVSGDRISSMRALMMMGSHNYGKRAFKKFSKFFDDGTVFDMLISDWILDSFSNLFKTQLLSGAPKFLQFACMCSDNLARRTFATRTREEKDCLKRMNEELIFKCPNCGKVYTVPQDVLD